ncbi:MAG TPA: hypothetical protein VNO26_04190 [Candidatus Limnocylindria bacterium]|nr:hypothetical protein [Candidatus Limnocylindria bacterium]
MLAAIDGPGRRTIEALRDADAALDATLRDETLSLGDAGALAGQVRELAAALQTLAPEEKGG